MLWKERLFGSYHETIQTPYDAIIRLSRLWAEIFQTVGSALIRPCVRTLDGVLIKLSRPESLIKTPSVESVELLFCELSSTIFYQKELGVIREKNLARL